MESSRIKLYRKRFELEQLPEILSTFTNKSGVYMLLDGDKKVVYVGQSKNLQWRLYQHLGVPSGRFFHKKEISYIDVVKVEKDRLMDIEQLLIQQFLPKYNTQIH
jgi:excinuclease UvrABC nuclease subunit